LWFHIGTIVDEESIKLGVNATPQFIGSLAELVWSQIGMLKMFLSIRWKRADRLFN
jgi:centromere protein S